jgi:hypothetical protein
MPPSGFSQKAVNGLLIFVESCYEEARKEDRKTSDTGRAKEYQKISN